jgi:hypothetical protein
MASSRIDVCETHIFVGINFALWKNHMLDHFRAKGPKFWWIVIVVSPMFWTIEISPKLKEFFMSLMYMLVVI